MSVSIEPIASLPGCVASACMRRYTTGLYAGLRAETASKCSSGHRFEPAQWWIGNAAEDGRAATVFARLRVPAPDGSGAIDDHGGSRGPMWVKNNASVQCNSTPLSVLLHDSAGAVPHQAAGADCRCARIHRAPTR